MQSFVPFLLIFLALVNAFQPAFVKFRHKSSALLASPPPEWELSNDFRTFLNQCSIQSFMFLLRQLRDMQTVFWMESFTQPVMAVTSTVSDKMDNADFTTGALDIPTTSPDNNNNNNNTTTTTITSDDKDKPQSKLLQYHGLSAINMTLFPTWDSYFKTMLLQEKESWTITSTKPYVPSYEWEINPPSLCARLISVREQIANEFANDLLVIEQMGQSTMDAYWDNVKQQQKQQQQSTHRPNLLFLDYDPNFNSDMAPSPLRKGNFDLLCLLTTQEAIHRVLNDPQRQEGAPLISNLFLQGFYQDRTQYFTGSQRYGRADDILQELLTETPRMITVTPGVTSLIDPIRITGLILTQREQVAKEWRKLAQSSPQEHFTVRKMMLNKMMGLDICPEDFQ